MCGIGVGGAGKDHLCTNLCRMVLEKEDGSGRRKLGYKGWGSPLIRNLQAGL